MLSKITSRGEGFAGSYGHRAPGTIFCEWKRFYLPDRDRPHGSCSALVWFGLV